MATYSQKLKNEIRFAMLHELHVLSEENEDAVLTIPQMQTRNGMILGGHTSQLLSRQLTDLISKGLVCKGKNSSGLMTYRLRNDKDMSVGTQKNFTINMKYEADGFSDFTDSVNKSYSERFAAKYNKDEDPEGDNFDEYDNQLY